MEMDEGRSKKFGITIVGFSSDGDPRLLRDMLLNTDLVSPLAEKKTYSIHKLQSPYILRQFQTGSGISEAQTKMKNAMYRTPLIF